MKLAIENRVHAFISDPILRELSDVLRREKFKLLEEQILEFILECAVKAKADYIISGDKDLLVLKEFLGTKIISPEQYFKLI